MKEGLREDVGGPATALALNKATTQVAVAGRSVLKIYNICEKGFELSANLRAVKSAVASCNDVAWNQVDDNILATATPSGSVITWNLSKPTLSKMDIVYQDHKRTVNKVHFHGMDPSLLLSGSQDSIKVFDLRQNEAVINYSGLSESVRDLQFSPHKFNTFIAVQDNGYAQIYDLRKKDKFELCFPGHNGPILACDWHPDHADCVATAGRDMSIKVWNVSTQTPSMQHCIPTMESVSKIRWSNENKNHIASCSLKRDYSINIWNILRPYIAYAKFTRPHEITTGMAWRSRQASLISITNIGILYQLSMSDAYRPLDHANPVGMAINPDGDIALALGNSLIRANSQMGSQNLRGDTKLSSGMLQSGSITSLNQQQQQQQQSSLPNRLPYQMAAGSLRGSRQSLTRRSQDSALNPRVSSRSQLDVYKCTEMNWFVKTAREYQLTNRPLAELCDHNAEVCAKLRRFQICQTWKILKLFYANIASSNQAPSGATNTHTTQSGTQTLANGTTSGGLNFVAMSSSRPSGSNHQQLLSGLDNLSIGSQLNAGSEFSYITKNPRSRNSLTQATSTGGNMEVNYDAALADENCSLAGSEETNDSTGDEWLSHETLSYEAFQPKHDFCGQLNKLLNKKLGDSHSTSGSSNHDEDEPPAMPQTSATTTTAKTAANASSRQQLGVVGSLKVSSNAFESTSTAAAGEHSELRITHLGNPKAYQYKFYEIIADVIADVLKYHVDNSDVQSAVSILIVLGDRIKNIVNERIPEVDRESWYHSYIDLLSKFQLWNVMAQVINLSPLQNINSINQTSTTIYTTCGTCNRLLNGRVGWICDRCKTKPSECSVCHGVVSGLMAWCQSCYHGGHLIHMSRWFMENEFCPTGCGHQCELGFWR